MKKRNFIFVIILLFLINSFVLASHSRPQFMEIFNNDQFAKQENKNKCSTCHINPNGGGPRKEFGQAFDNNGRKITNELRQQFPNLFNLLEFVKPKIKRIKPGKLTIGEETKIIITGKNFEEDIVLEVDGIAINNLSGVQVEFINEKRIELTIMFEEVGKHTIQAINTLGQRSNIVKLKVKNL